LKQAGQPVVLRARGTGKTPDEHNSRNKAKQERQHDHD
jgi:hypothetical protein